MAEAAVRVIAVGNWRSRSGVRNSCLMHMRMMADMAHAGGFLVRAVTRRCTPGELEWQNENKKDEQ